MSRPKYWWHDYVKQAIIHNLAGDGHETIQQVIVDKAVKKAIEETRQKDRGDERIKMIDLVYRKRQYNLQGAAVHLHISEGTARDWSREFIYLVMEKAGFL